ncbi:MAG: gspL [Deltaproteobacteria bacterium]|nr:gspL [Deltaproteobacteria bacterium]
MFITVIQTTATEFILSRYQSRRGSLQFLRGVRHQLTDEESTVADILASWQGECQGDRIVLALPPNLLSLRELDLPLTDRKKGREILPLELKGELASDADEPVFEVLPLAGGKTAAIWSKRQLLAAEIDFLTDHGFDPEVATFSLFNWQKLLPESCRAAVAITDGEGVAVYLDGKPLFFRILPKAGKRPLDATITALELAKDIQVETVFTLGSAAIDTGLTTTPLAPGSAVTAVFAGDAAAAVDLAAQFAMAQELVSGEPVNLRRGPLSFTKTRDQFRTKLRFTWALLAVLLILIFAEAGVRYFLARRDVASLNSSIRSIYREVFPTRTKPVDEVAELKAEIKKLGGTGSEGVLAVLKKLTEAKGDDPREIYELDFDGSQVTGKGYDRSAQGVNDFKTKAAPLFTGFEVSEIKSRPDGSVSFAFRGTLKGGGK